MTMTKKQQVNTGVKLKLVNAVNLTRSTEHGDLVYELCADL